MNPRLIVADFDGTAVNSTLTLDPQVPELINDLKNRGVLFSFATGRPFKGALQNICYSLGLAGPQIILNGAEIIKALGEKVLWSCHMDWEITKPLINFLKNSNQAFRVECRDTIYFGNLPLPEPENNRLQFHSINNLNPRPIAKILIEPDSETALDSIELEIKNKFPSLSIMRNRLRPQIEDLNVTAPGVDKGQAMQELLRFLNVPQAAVVAIGNSEVDVSLLEGAAVKVAVEQSPQLIKIADFTVKSPPDGFVIFLQRILKEFL